MIAATPDQLGREYFKRFNQSKSPLHSSVYFRARHLNMFGNSSQALHQTVATFKDFRFESFENVCSTVEGFYTIYTIK